jgi:hypothetical protein
VGIDAKGYTDPMAPGKVNVEPAAYVSTPDGQGVVDDQTGETWTDDEFVNDFIDAIGGYKTVVTDGVNPEGYTKLKEAPPGTPGSFDAVPASVIRKPDGTIGVGYNYQGENVPASLKGANAGVAAGEAAAKGKGGQQPPAKDPALNGLKPAAPSTPPATRSVTAPPSVQRDVPSTPPTGAAAGSYNAMGGKVAAASGKPAAGGGTNGGAAGAVGLDKSPGLTKTTELKNDPKTEPKTQPKAPENKDQPKAAPQQKEAPTNAAPAGGGAKTDLKTKSETKDTPERARDGGSGAGAGGVSTPDTRKDVATGGNGEGAPTPEEQAPPAQPIPEPEKKPDSAPVPDTSGYKAPEVKDFKDKFTALKNPPKEPRKVFEPVPVPETKPVPADPKKNGNGIDLSRETPSTNVEVAPPMTDEEKKKALAETGPVQGVLTAFEAEKKNAHSAIQGSDAEWEAKGKGEQKKAYEQALDALAQGLGKRGKDVDFKEVKQKRPNPMLDLTKNEGIVTHWFDGASSLGQMRDILAKDKIGYQAGYQFIIDEQGNLSFTQPITPDGMRVVNHTGGADTAGKDFNDNYLGVVTAGKEPNPEQLKTAMALGEFLKTLNPNMKVTAHGAESAKKGAKDRGVTSDKKVREGLALADAVGQGGNVVPNGTPAEGEKEEKKSENEDEATDYTDDESTAKQGADPRKHYRDNAAVGSKDVIWDTLHPDLVRDKDRILDEGKIRTGALIAADAVYRHAEKKGVPMHVAVGGGADDHSANHLKKGIGEALDIKPGGRNEHSNTWTKYKADPVEYAKVAVAAIQLNGGSARVGVPMNMSNGLHVQDTGKNGLNRPSLSWVYGRDTIGAGRTGGGPKTFRGQLQKGTVKEKLATYIPTLYGAPQVNRKPPAQAVVGLPGSIADTPTSLEKLAKVAKKANATESQLGKLSGVPATENEQADEIAAGSATPPEPKGKTRSIAGTQLPDVKIVDTKEAAPEDGVAPTGDTVTTAANPPVTIPVVSSMISFLPQPVQEVLAAISDAFWGALGYGPKPPPQVNIDNLNPGDTIPGSPYKMGPADQVVYKNNLGEKEKEEAAAVGQEEKKLKPGEEKKMVEKTITKKVTSQEPTKLANTLADLNAKVKNGSLPLDKALEQAQAAAAAAGVKLEFTQYDPNAAVPEGMKLVGVLKDVPADMIPKDLVPVAMQAKLGVAQFVNAKVEIAVYAPAAALTETVVREVKEKVMVPSDGSEPEVPAADGDQEAGTPEQPGDGEQPAPAQPEAAPAEDAAIEKGAKAVGQIVKEVYQGGKKVVSDTWDSLRDLLGGGNSGTPVPREDTPTLPATTTKVKSSRVIQ